MTTEVILTGTGIPAPVVSSRAGPGALVRVDETILQFDAGRGTTLRLAELDVLCSDIDAMFLTHHHSDHLVDLADIVMTRWFLTDTTADPALPVIAPDGPCSRFVARLLDPWADDIAVRQAFHDTATSPAVKLTAFDAPSVPKVVWIRDGVTVSAVAVHHEPVVPSVAYRVDTSDGSIVISGDTVVCAELEDLAHGASVLVHEALCESALAGASYSDVVRYHATTVEIGKMAARCGVPVLILTHLIPPPMSRESEDVFEQDVRSGGFQGRVVVGSDLCRFRLAEASKGRSSLTQ